MTVLFKAWLQNLVAQVFLTWVNDVAFQQIVTARLLQCTVTVLAVLQDGLQVAVNTKLDHNTVWKYKNTFILCEL